MRFVSRVLSVAALFCAFAFSAQAQQGELPLTHGDDVVLEASVGDANVIPMTEAERFLPKAGKTFSGIELGVELGDGYYDIRSSKLYKVVDTNGFILGYLEVCEVYYTEDNEVFEYIVRVSVSGVRLDDIESDR